MNDLVQKKRELEQAVSLLTEQVKNLYEQKRTLEKDIVNLNHEARRKAQILDEIREQIARFRLKVLSEKAS